MVNMTTTLMPKTARVSTATLTTVTEEEGDLPASFGADLRGLRSLLSTGRGYKTDPPPRKWVLGLPLIPVAALAGVAYFNPDNAQVMLGAALVLSVFVCYRVLGPKVVAFIGIPLVPFAFFFWHNTVDSPDSPVLAAKIASAIIYLLGAGVAYWLYAKFVLLKIERSLVIAEERWMIKAYSVRVASYRQGLLDQRNQAQTQRVAQQQASSIEQLAAELGVDIKPAASLPTFATIGGMSELKALMDRKIGVVLRNREAAATMNKSLGGVLYWGSPGNGKSLFAEACAGEFGYDFVLLDKGTLSTAGLQGKSSEKIRMVFQLARAMSASGRRVALLFDEFDSLAGSRSEAGGGGNTTVEDVSTFLTGLTSVYSDPNILILAATNYIDNLDSGVIRPGRFDIKIEITNPDAEARSLIIKAKLVSVPQEALDLTPIVALTTDMTGADITSICDQAVGNALFRTDQNGGVVVPMTQDDLVSAAKSFREKITLQLSETATWDQLILPPETVARLQQLEHMLVSPEDYTKLGVKVPPGALLWGPPGTGKSKIARVLASQANCSFMELEGVSSKWVGEGQKNLTKAFKRAAASAPCILFIDEIDGLLASRDAIGANSENSGMVATFLQALDGLHAYKGVFVLAATNKPEQLDSAVRRDGRLGFQIEIGLPGRDDRVRLLQFYTKTKPISSVDLDALATATDGYSPSSIEGLCQRAGMVAARKKADVITQADFDTAMDEIAEAA